MALAILTGYYFLNAEVKRKEKARLIKSFVNKKGKIVKPNDQLNTVVFISIVSGVIGARVFSILEYPNQFLEAPLYTLLSPAGFTYYGGLIFGVLAVALYAKRINLKLVHLLDAAAPALLIAYAVGRLGCHLSGDGDWGIDNFSSKPSFLYFLPDSFWAYKYPHNVIEEGVPIANCYGKYCMELMNPVFPTALYETIVCLILFLGLWLLRTKVTLPGVLFGCYLLLNGIERFLIEQIRVDAEFNWFGVKFKQAEAIALLLTLFGLSYLCFIWRRSRKNKTVITNSYLRFNNEYNK